MNRKKNYYFIHLILWIIFIIVVVQYVVKDISFVRDGRPLFILRNMGLDYNSKMEMQVGKLPYDYIMFIKGNTPEDSTILIPPQAYPWDKTSNAAYLRYFLYPRVLINGNEKDPKVNKTSVDYILIDFGETNVSQYGYTNVWPKFNVAGEYIIYWDSKNGKTWRDSTGIYKYVPGDKRERWGLIKIKK